MAKNKTFIRFRKLIAAVKQGDTIFLTVNFPSAVQKKAQTICAKPSQSACQQQRFLLRRRPNC